jgi:hypothetical protein
VFDVLTSSQLATVIRVALIAVAALVLTAAELRVIAKPPPRRVRYVVAWLACSAILGGLAIYLDTRVGLTAPGDRVLSVAGAALLSAAALAVGAWWTRRPAWNSYSRPIAVASLLAVQAAIATAVLSLR